MNLQESIDSLPSRITAAIKDLFPSADARVAELQSKLTAAEAAAATQTAALEEANKSIKAVTDKNAEQAKTIETLTARVTELEAAAKTTAQTARELVAAQGVPVATLPANNGEAAATKDKEAQLAALREQAATEQDPKKKFELLRQCRVLRDGEDWINR